MKGKKTISHSVESASFPELSNFLCDADKLPCELSTLSNRGTKQVYLSVVRMQQTQEDIEKKGNSVSDI